MKGFNRKNIQTKMDENGWQSVIRKETPERTACKYEELTKKLIGLAIYKGIMQLNSIFVTII